MHSYKWKKASASATRRLGSFAMAVLMFISLIGLIGPVSTTTAEPVEPAEATSAEATSVDGSSGRIFDAAIQGGKFVLVYNNETNLAVEGYLIVAEYNNKNQLVAVEMQEFKAQPNQSDIKVFSEISIGDNNYKAFCWDELYIPLEPVVTEFTVYEMASTIVVKKDSASNVMTVGTASITVKPGTTAAQLLNEITARDEALLGYSVSMNGQTASPDAELIGWVTDVSGNNISREAGHVLNISLPGTDLTASRKIEVYNQAKLDELGDYWDDVKYRTIDETVNMNTPAFKNVDYFITDSKYESLIDKEFVETYGTAANNNAANSTLDRLSTRVIWHYGAVIQAAIDECSLNGGGRVVVPAIPGMGASTDPVDADSISVYYTGALWLKSNVNLYIEKGAKLRWVRNINNEQYPLRLTQFEGSDLYTYSPFIYALNEKNIAITGGGTIDGSADDYNWYNWKIAANAPGQYVGGYTEQANYLTGGYTSAGAPIVGFNIDKVAVTKRIFTWNGQAPPAGTKIPIVEGYPLAWGEEGQAQWTAAGNADGNGTDWSKIGETKWIDIPDDAIIGPSHTSTSNYTPRYNQISRLRSSFIQPYLCENVLIEGITVNRSPMWQVHPMLSENVLIRGLRINSGAANNDGVNPDSCKNVVLEGIDIVTGDDCIAIKSGKNEDGQRRNRYSENLIIRDVTFRGTNGAITIGSECAGAVRNLFTTDNAFNSGVLNQVIRFKTNSKRSSKLIEKMYHKDSFILRATRLINADTSYSAGGLDAGDYGAFIPTVKDMYCYNFQSARDGLPDNLGMNATGAVFTFTAYARAPFRDMHFKNCTLIGVANAAINNMSNLELINVAMSGTGTANNTNVKIYNTTPILISDVKISDDGGATFMPLDEDKDFAQQPIGRLTTLIVTGRIDDNGPGSGRSKTTNLIIVADRGTGSGHTGSSQNVTPNADGTFSATITLRDDPFSVDKANHFISIRAQNTPTPEGGTGTANVLPNGNQAVSVYRVRYVILPEIALKASHPQIESLDASKRNIVAVSGAKAGEVIDQVEPVRTGASYTYKIVDWLGDEKAGANLDMLTTGDVLVVTGEGTELEYTIEVPGEAPYWNSVKYNEILKTVKDNLPQFKPDIYDITDPKYAAFIRTTGGTTDYTVVFREAIRECTGNGGGTVLVPARAQPYFTGAIMLDNNVNLHVEKGATIDFIPATAANAAELFPRAITTFEGIDFYGFANPIYAGFKENIAITGGGTITYSNVGSWNGDVDNTIRQWNFAKTPIEMRDAFKLGQRVNPCLVEIYGCKNVVLSGVTLGNSPMWSMNIVLSENILVRGMTLTSDSSNSDGCNPESSRNIIIENNFFANQDDNIALKAGRIYNGKMRGRSTEKIIIRNNEFFIGSGISIGSESAGGVNDIFVENNFFNGIYEHTPAQGTRCVRNLFRIKTLNSSDAVFENIYFRNIPVGGMRECFIIIERVADNDYNFATGELYGTLNNVPIMRNFAFSNIFTVANRVNGNVDSLFSQFFMKVEPSDLRPIEGFYMKDINMRSTGIGSNYKYMMVNNVNNLNMVNVRMNNAVYNTERFIELTDIKANGVPLSETGATEVTSTGTNGTLVVTGVVDTDIANFETVGSVRVSFDFDRYRSTMSGEPITWAAATLSRGADGKVNFTATLTNVGADLHDLAIVAKSNRLPHYVVNDTESARGTIDMVYHDIKAYKIDVEGTLRAMKVTYLYDPPLTPFHNAPMFAQGDSVKVTCVVTDAKTGLPVTGATLTQTPSQTVFPCTVSGLEMTIRASNATTNRNHIGISITANGYVRHTHYFRRVVTATAANLATIIP